MVASHDLTRPLVGMTLAFRDPDSASLIDLPARVVDVWPRFPSGDYLVTLEYPRPVHWGNELTLHVHAFMSELYQPVRARDLPTTQSRIVRFNAACMRWSYLLISCVRNMTSGSSMSSYEEFARH